LLSHLPPNEAFSDLDNESHFKRIEGEYWHFDPKFNLSDLLKSSQLITFDRTLFPRPHLSPSERLSGSDKD